MALDISKAFDRVWHAGILHKLKSYAISGQIFGLISSFHVFKWFRMEGPHKNIQLVLEFVKAPFLVLQFSCYTLMTFLTMSSVILLSMLMMLLSILSVIRHLICGNNKPVNLGELLTMRFDHNIIQNTNLLGDAVEHSMASKLSLFIH